MKEVASSISDEDAAKFHRRKNPIQVDKAELMSIISGPTERVSLIQGPPGKSSRSRVFHILF
jgi:hypothetical protein